MKFEHVFVIGAGGIGSHVMEPLCRLLAYHDNGTKEITLVDGDIYEEKNQVRQLFDPDFLGMNKAESLAQQVSKACCFEVNHFPYYINRDSFIELMKNTVEDDAPVLVVTAVDNHATRKAVIEALDSSRKNFIFLSGGNGYANGQALVYGKICGEPATVHPFEKYDDLKYPDDHIPGDPGCQDEAPSEPQLITANMGAALGIMWLVQAMLDDEPWYEELHFDSQRMKLIPQGDAITYKDASDEDDVEVTLISEEESLEEMEIEDVELPGILADAEALEPEEADLEEEADIELEEEADIELEEEADIELEAEGGDAEVLEPIVS